MKKIFFIFIFFTSIYVNNVTLEAKSTNINLSLDIFADNKYRESVNYQTSISDADMSKFDDIILRENLSLDNVEQYYFKFKISSKNIDPTKISQINLNFNSSDEIIKTITYSKSVVEDGRFANFELKVPIEYLTINHNKYFISYDIYYDYTLSYSGNIVFPKIVDDIEYKNENYYYLGTYKEDTTDEEIEINKYEIVYNEKSYTYIVNVMYDMDSDTEEIFLKVDNEIPFEIQIFEHELKLGDKTFYLEELVSAKDIRIFVTEKEQISLAKKYSDFDESKECKLVYYSLNTDIAKVSDTGVVYGVSEGDTTIDIYCNGKYLTTCNVHVSGNKYKHLKLSDTKLMLKVGDTYNLEITTKLSDVEREEQITFKTILDYDIIQVDNTGFIRAIDAGLTEIRVYYSEYLVACCKVEVEDRNDNVVKNNIIKKLNTDYKEISSVEDSKILIKNKVINFRILMISITIICFVIAIAILKGLLQLLIKM